MVEIRIVTPKVADSNSASPAILDEGVAQLAVRQIVHLNVAGSTPTILASPFKSKNCIITALMEGEKLWKQKKILLRKIWSH